MNTVSKSFPHDVQHVLAAESITKVCVRWVHTQLTDENKRAQVNQAWKFLTQHPCNPTAILSIATDDESWILYITPAWKEDTWVWHKKGEPTQKKINLDHSTKKILCTSLWDCWGVQSIGFQERGNKVWIPKNKCRFWRIMLKRASPPSWHLVTLISQPIHYYHHHYHHYHYHHHHHHRGFNNK